MKILFSAICLIFFSSSFRAHLSRQKLSIPRYQENAAIDHLMELILNDKTTLQQENVKESRFSWLIMDAIQVNKGIWSFSLRLANEPFINMSVNRLSLDKRNSIGYFYYKRLKVYLLLNNAILTFCVKTPESTSFKFLHKLKNLDVRKHIKALQGMSLFSWDYEYKDGRFFKSPRPPAVR